jgi:tripartite-type tricarboxylate transporter receptor subunit TctC
VVHVPYTGGGPYLQALASNEVQLGLVPSLSAMNTFGSRVRALAITSPKRIPSLPDVPTMTELGFPQIKGLAYSLNAPAGTPRFALDKLRSAAQKVMQEPDFKSRIDKMGFEIIEQSPEVAAKALADEARFLADVAKKINFQPS